jgi:hypothetical protein
VEMSEEQEASVPRKGRAGKHKGACRHPGCTVCEPRVG